MDVGNLITRELIQRLSLVEGDGDRELDANIWHHLGDHSATAARLLDLADTLGMPVALDQFMGTEWRSHKASTPAPTTRSVDAALEFGRQLLRYREPRFAVFEAADGTWVASVSTGSGEDALAVNSTHPCPAPAVIQAILRQYLMIPSH